jgi:hemolysin activation/secretion protein
VRLEGPTSATLFHLSRDRLRVLYGRIDFEAIDRDSITSTQGYSVSEPRWRVAGSYEVRKGLDILDATDACAIAACPLPTLSRPEGRPTAALVRFAGTAEFRPVPKVTLAISPRAQYTRSALASYEEMSGGNYTVGRGYDPGTIIGDKGGGFQAEFRVGSLSPKSQDDLALQPYAFLDQAWVWNNGRRRRPCCLWQPRPARRDRRDPAPAGRAARCARRYALAGFADDQAHPLVSACFSLSSR